MKAQHYIVLVLSALLASCDGSPCGCGSEPALKDTEFTIAYKLVDGSWDTTKRTLPSTAMFWVGSTEKSTYALFNKENDKDDGHLLKTAVIDYKLVGSKLVLDTTAKKVELITPEKPD